MSNTHLPPSIQSAPVPKRVVGEIASVPAHTWAWVWNRIPAFLLRHATTLLRLLYALQSEGRSFLGHTRTLLAKKHWGADLGPVWEHLPSGHLTPNVRTNARDLGIQELVLRHPWASSIDREIFLEGFDVGELYALGTASRSERMRAAMDSCSGSRHEIDAESSRTMPPGGVARSDDRTRQKL
jgi:hypothetical protein